MIRFLVSVLGGVLFGFLIAVVCDCVFKVPVYLTTAVYAIVAFLAAMATGWAYDACKGKGGRR